MSFTNLGTLSRMLAAILMVVSLTSLPSNSQTGAPKLRLPTTVQPLRYTADLHVTPGQDNIVRNSRCTADSQDSSNNGAG